MKSRILLPPLKQKSTSTQNKYRYCETGVFLRALSSGANGRNGDEMLQTKIQHKENIIPATISNSKILSNANVHNGLEPFHGLGATSFNVLNDLYKLSVINAKYVRFQVVSPQRVVVSPFSHVLRAVASTSNVT